MRLLREGGCVCVCMAHVWVCGLWEPAGDKHETVEQGDDGVALGAEMLGHVVGVGNFEVCNDVGWLGLNCMTKSLLPQF